MIAHVEARANETPLALRLQNVTVDETAQAEVHLTAAIPSGSQTLTWRSTLVFGSYPIAVRGLDGREVIEWLQGPQTSRPIALDSPHAPTGFVKGLAMGFTHIVPAGLDHILFVLGLFLLSRRTRRCWCRSRRSPSHTRSRSGLSLYGLVSAPASIVEPMIALSVAYVGVENLMTSRLHPWRVRCRLCVRPAARHGLRRGARRTASLARHFLTTLVSFNLGVEAGQLAVIAAAAVVLAIVTRLHATASVPTIRLASAAIGVVGTIWTIQRLTGG